MLHNHMCTINTVFWNKFTILKRSDYTYTDHRSHSRNAIIVENTQHTTTIYLFILEGEIRIAILYYGHVNVRKIIYYYHHFFTHQLLDRFFGIEI